VKIAVATLRESILNRIRRIGKKLVESLLETLKMFRDDAAKSGYKL
jgi:hypothetical protein